MSEIADAGSPSGAHGFEQPHGGRGVLMGGCTGVQPAWWVGCRHRGRECGSRAAAMTGSDSGGSIPRKLRSLCSKARPIDECGSSRGLLERLVPSADLLIGAVLTPEDSPTVDEDLPTR